MSDYGDRESYISNYVGKNCVDEILSYHKRKTHTFVNSFGELRYEAVLR